MATLPQIASKKKRKSTNEASAATKRKLTLVVELLTQRRVRFSSYQKMFGKGLRTFQRDLQQIEKIGETSGFKLGGVKDGEIVELIALDGKTKKLNGDSKRLERILVTMAQALGEPIVRELGSRASDAAESDDFFTFAGPKLIEGTTVADICATLREACSSPTGRAAVRFRFRSASKGTVSEREVEPYGVLGRSGKFYLIGYDRGRKAWRFFAIHRFTSKPVKAGTCVKERVVPETYRSGDVIGFIKKDNKQLDITVELAANVAPSVTSQEWQASQRVETLADGRAQITFSVSDIDEVVRWALGFGAAARVIAPPEAVERARVISTEIAGSYRGATTG
jgi:predicted DNA-binding transcriptional regulator YafY